MEDTHFVEQDNRDAASLAFADIGAEPDQECLDVLPVDVRAGGVREDRFQRSPVGALFF